MTAAAFEKPRPSHVRFLVVGLATLVSFLLYVDRFSLSFVERSMKDDLGLTNRESSWVLAAFFLSYALAQVPSGWLSDRFGARLMLTLYVLLWSLFTGLMGVVAVLAALVAFRLGCGLAQAGAYPTCGSVLSRWVPFAERGVASSVVAVGGRVGGATAPLLTAYLLLALDWRSVLLLYGLVGVLVAAAFWLYYRDWPRLHPRCNTAEVFQIEGGRPAGLSSPHGRVGALPLRYLAGNRSLWCSSLSQFGTNFGWIFLLNWLPRYLEEVHDPPLTERGWMAFTPPFVGIAGMFCGGWLTDGLARALGLRWGRRLPMALSRFSAMAAYLACLALRSPWAVVAALAVVAFSTDLGTASVWAFKQDVGGRHVGSVLGWGNMWGNVGAFAATLVLNDLAVAHGWGAVFLACAAAFFVAGIAALGVDATSPVAPPNEL